MLGSRPWVSGVIALSASLLAGCGGSGVVAPVTGVDAPPDSASRASVAPSPRYTVQRGDTLYSIAWRYGLDYRDVAAANGIAEPFTIYPGQRLWVRAGDVAASIENASAARGSARTRPLPPQGDTRVAREIEASKAPATAPDTSAPRASDSSVKPSTARAAPSTAKAPAAHTSASATSAPASWRWPTKGSVIARFSRSGSKGVDIAGRSGQPVHAASAGKVVYSGGGLIGYGKLIILKHDKRFLSAYAHNDRLLVQEGDVVAAGQHIADMGRTGTDRVKLHFEIRRDGKPVDPLRYLPR